ncbi:MAG: hypothetical protein ACO3XO_03735 [Bdellovibrionota bacterium]
MHTTRSEHGHDENRRQQAQGDVANTQFSDASYSSSLRASTREGFSRLQADPHFQKVDKACQRAIQSLEGRGEHPSLQPEARVKEQVKQTFARYTRALLLHQAGVSHRDIEQGERHRIPQGWFSGGVPALIHQYDPEPASYQAKELTLNPDMTRERAYVLGAFAAVAGSGSSCETISFYDKGAESLNELKHNLKDGLGLDVRIYSEMRAETDQAEWRRIALNRKAFTQFIACETDNNRHLSWRHLLTSEDRRSFLRGFITFTGIGTDFPRSGMRIRKGDGEQLMKEIAVVFKREGIFPKVETGKMPGIGIRDRVELEKLISKDLIPESPLRDSIEKYLEATKNRRSYTPEQYHRVLHIAESLADRGPVTVSAIQKVLTGSPQSVEISSFAIMRWLDGKKPSSALRTAELEVVEQNLEERGVFREVALDIAQKARSVNYNVHGVVQMLSDFAGGDDALAKIAEIRVKDITDFSEGKRVPTPQQYKAILASVGLRLDDDFQLGMFPPSSRDIAEQLKGNKNAPLAATYAASLTYAAERAFRRGEHAMEGVMAKLDELVARRDAMSK